MPSLITERRLVDVLAAFLRKEGDVYREVPHYEKRIDLVTYCRDASSIVAIEAKSCNWQRAVQQAMLNLTAVDLSYVAIWSAKAHLVDRDTLEHFGIGLIAVGTRWGDVEYLVSARQSSLTNRFVRQQIGERFHLECLA